MHMLSETENKAIAISRELSLNKIRKLAKTLEKPQKFSNSHILSLWKTLENFWKLLQTLENSQKLLKTFEHSKTLENS